MAKVVVETLVARLGVVALVAAMVAAMAEAVATAWGAQGAPWAALRVEGQMVAAATLEEGRLVGTWALESMAVVEESVAVAVLVADLVAALVAALGEQQVALVDCSVMAVEAAVAPAEAAVVAKVGHQALDGAGD